MFQKYSRLTLNFQSKLFYILPRSRQGKNIRFLDIGKAVIFKLVYYKERQRAVGAELNRLFFAVFTMS